METEETQEELNARLSAILEETKSYYSDTSKRAVQKNGSVQERCMYLTADGRKCAVGRCLSDDILERVRDTGWNSDTVKDIKERLTNIGVPIKFTDAKYENVPITFWIVLQHFHDATDNFETEGLTLKGRYKIAEIQDLITANHFKPYDVVF